MKRLLFLLLITIFSCSPDNELEFIDQQSTSPESIENLNLAANQNLNRNSSNIFLSETFENANLENDPYSGDFYPEFALDHSFNLDKNIRRGGNAAGRFEINKNDPKLWGGYRAEFAQALSTTMEEGWYGFSQYFPDTYMIDTTKEVVGQWHDQPDNGETAARSPSNAIYTGNGRLKWTTRWDSRSIQTNNITEGYFEKDLGVIPKNKWIDWVVHIKFSHTNTGILEVWMDGIKVIDRQYMPNSYNDTKNPYFKFGVYRWEWGTTVTERVIYYDEIKVGDKNSSYEDVKPMSSQELVPIDPQINMVVNGYTVNCVGEMEGKCLLVQEGDMIGTKNWKTFYYYNSIEGFTYEPGFIYGLEVKKIDVENPPAGSSSIRYELVKLISKKLA